MTGCLYISPSVFLAGKDLGVLPVLLADTLISFNDERGNAPAITPATLGPQPGRHRSSVILGRKVHIIGEAAIAMAGRGDLIAECAGTVRWNLPEWEKSERPMRALGDLANLYKTRGPLEVIGIHARYVGGRVVFNTMARTLPATPTGSLGFVAAIGKGDSDLLDLAERFEPYFARSEGDIYLRVRDFVGAINGVRLVAEIVGSAGNSWGGFVEYVRFDYGGRCWTRGESNLHLFLRVKPSTDGTTPAEIELVSRCVAYDPGGEWARVLAVSGNQDSTAIAEFQLRDGPPDEPSLDFWKSWRPSSTTVTMYCETDAGPLCLTKTLAPSEAAGAHFDILEETVGYGMTDELVEGLVASWNAVQQSRNNPEPATEQ